MKTRLASALLAFLLISVSPIIFAEGYCTTFKSTSNYNEIIITVPNEYSWSDIESCINASCTISGRDLKITDIDSPAKIKTHADRNEYQEEDLYILVTLYITEAADTFGIPTTEARLCGGNSHSNIYNNESAAGAVAGATLNP